MFTVIIAEKNIIDTYRRFKAFFHPLLNDEIAFCEWNTRGENLLEMVPDIYDITEKKRQWQALIITDSNKNQPNPFDFTGYKESPLPKVDVTSDILRDRLCERIGVCEDAVKIPLIRLATALARPNMGDTVAELSDMTDICEGKKDFLLYMLTMQMNALDLGRVSIELADYKRQRLSKLVPTEDAIDTVAYFVKHGDAEGIVSILDERDIIPFIRLIGDDDARYYDAGYCIDQLVNTKKTELFAPFNVSFELNDTKPEHIICYSARTYDIEKYKRNDSWAKRDESEYSKFCEYNLYPEGLNYLLFDLKPEIHKQYLSDVIKWLASALVFAANDFPNSALAGKRVYSADVVFHADSITKFCTESLSKLRATLVKLKEIDADIVASSIGELDNKTASELFLQSSTIPVTIDTEFSTAKLYADSSDIGLSRDCPKNEYTDWKAQFADIEKNFITYLRQPKRALKNAVTGEFRKKNTVSDERALWLNENQREDVMYKLLEDEEAAATDETISLYNTKEFRKDLKRADSQLRKRMEKRMTRKQTVAVGGIALGAFAFGFLPLLFSHLNTGKSFLFSVLFAAVALALFAGCGILRLIGFRKEILAGFYDFNAAMHGVVSKINASLGSFSRYLVHICDVMRGHSILDYPDNAVLEKRNVLIKHKEDIEKKIDEIQNIFASYLPDRIVLDGTEQPFNYDFTVSAEYDYDIEYPECGGAIKYVQIGSEIRLPVDYISSITLVREEFYDY